MDVSDYQCARMACFCPRIDFHSNFKEPCYMHTMCLYLIYVWQIQRLVLKPFIWDRNAALNIQWVPVENEKSEVPRRKSLGDSASPIPRGGRPAKSRMMMPTVCPTLQNTERGSNVCWDVVALCHGYWVDEAYLRPWEMVKSVSFCRESCNTMQVCPWSKYHRTMRHTRISWKSRHIIAWECGGK